MYHDHENYAIFLNIDNGLRRNLFQIKVSREFKFRYAIGLSSGDKQHPELVYEYP
jgi:hypothetical protein